MNDERPIIVFWDDRSLFSYLNVVYFFSDVLNERVDKERTRLIDDFAEEWCVEPEAVEYVIETYDVNKDPDDKQDNQDTLREASHVKEYRKKIPCCQRPQVLAEPHNGLAGAVCRETAETDGTLVSCLADRMGADGEVFQQSGVRGISR